jgi:type III pantothenate kinase
MLLTIDSGNTTINVAVMKGRRVVKLYTISMLQSKRMIIAGFIKTITEVSKEFSGINAAVICSVVPNIVNVIKKTIIQNASLPVFIVGKDVIVPITNNYKVPGQVGQDRLVGAYAAKEIYGYPAIVIDSGTAITFDVVSVKGAYEGGIIVPGIRLSAEALHTKTALLPKIEDIRWPRRLIGKDTQESILSGLFHGYSALCEGLIEKIKKELNADVKVIATGGSAPLIKKALKNKIDVIDADLVFKGMRLLYGQSVM